MGVKPAISLVAKFFIIFLPSAFFFAYLAETALQITLPNNIKDKFSQDSLSWKVTGQHRLDERLLYKMVPSIRGENENNEYKEKYSINKYGFRDVEFDLSPEITRIYIVGDSFTYGVGIEENTKTLAKKLEESLRSHNPIKNFRVYNLGTMGYSPDQEFRLISERVIPKFKPDIIIWNIVIPSDLYDGSFADNWPIPALYGISNGNLASYDARLNWFYPRNYLGQKFPSVFQKSLTFGIFFRYLSGNHIFNRKPNLTNHELIKWAAKKIVMQAEEIKQQNISGALGPLIVFTPNKEHWHYSESSDYTQAFELLKSELFNKEIEFIDISEILLKKGIDTSKLEGEPGLYFKYDFHPNEFGVKVFSDEILEGLIGIIEETKGIGEEGG